MSITEELAAELGFFVNEFGWAVRNDEPRGTYEGANGTRYQLSLWNALIIARTELTALREENARLKGCAGVSEALELAAREADKFVGKPCVASHVASNIRALKP